MALGRLYSGDLSIFEHGVDHQVAALDSAIRMGYGRIDAGRFRQACEKRCFLQHQIRRRFFEVELGGRLKAIDAVAEIDLIRVECENLLLGETTLNLDGQQSFLNFSVKRAVGGKEQVTGKLHGQRGRALNSTPGKNVSVGGAGDAPNINSPVTVKVLVFDRNQGVSQHLRILFIRRNDPVLQSECSDDVVL